LPDLNISIEAARTVREFVRAAVSKLREVPRDGLVEWVGDSQWERASDGSFRERGRLARIAGRTFSDEWLRSIPGYDKCIDRLNSDAVIGRHMNRLVGTTVMRHQLQPQLVLRSLISTMLADDGTFVFSDEKFESEWLEFCNFFNADRIAYTLVAPLPYFTAAFPLRLSDELVIDRLTEAEVTRCCQYGLLRPITQRFPIISAEVAVGIRRTTLLPKFIQPDDGSAVIQEAALTDEGNFGRRPVFRDDLVIDDVLSALRLFKHVGISATGHVLWTDSSFLPAVVFRILRASTFGGRSGLSPGELPQFLQLWHDLEKRAAPFGFVIHRFNLAFERGLIADRIVDLVIAAESLLLGDVDSPDRGELRFRCALRAAKFIESPHYNERDVFRITRRAYDIRSAMVHGHGPPKDTPLPDNSSAALPVFIDAFEELVRLAIRKAVSTDEAAKKLNRADYWESLVLSSRQSVGDASAERLSN
jgi:hypothetical protein